MQDKRSRRAKLNMVTTLMRQVLATVCGIVIPRVMIGAFGSVVYGATVSIAQFLSYISLLEGGIGRVTRGALYKPLAERDSVQISKIYQAARQFFRVVGGCFCVYTIVLALSYHDLAEITVFSREYTFFLVVVISLSTIATYFGGIGNMTLMHADQRQYLTNTIITVTNVINTLCIVLLVKMNADVLTVKLFSSIVFIVRPILYSWYVRKHYDLPKVEKDASALSQKWTGIGQHIAYFLHTNTDVVLLTLLADLKMVAVYSIYHLVVNSIWNISSSFAGGMEAAFGEMIAKREDEAFRKAYRSYKSIIAFVSLVLFSCAAVLIIPFVKLYLADVSDADYVRPLFGLLLLLAEFINSIALPCTTMPISANHLKQTRLGSYGEAVLNISLSLLLIQWNPLLGVAIGTLCASVFKNIYYMVYSARHLLRCGIWSVLGRFLACVGVMLAVSVAGMHFLMNVQMANFLVWMGWGVVSVFVTGIVAAVFCMAAFPQEAKQLAQKLYAFIKH